MHSVRFKICGYEQFHFTWLLKFCHHVKDLCCNIPVCFSDYTFQATEETNSNSASNLNMHATGDEVVQNSTTQVTENIVYGTTGKLRHRSRSSTVHRSGSFSGGLAYPHICLCGVKSPLPKCDSVCSEPAGDISGLQTKQLTESSHCVEKLSHSECHDSLLFSEVKKFTPHSASFHHSTPEDRDSATVSHMISRNESESMFLSKDDCPYEDIDTSVFVRNTLSWHDSVNIEPSPSQSCMSLDDSLFLRELNIEGSNEAEVLETCTAVSSLEQLEQEVAGVLSDCGDMERCFGVLRRRDSIKAVVGRYSLGVADSVLAGDKCSRRQELTDSPIIDETSLSSSVGIVRHSGFMWDDEGFDTDSPSIRFIPVNHRATRSLSPQPAVQHQHDDCRASLGIRVNSRGIGNTTDYTHFDSNTSTDLAPCSVYDVNRRLSGRLHVQHVNN